MKANRKFIQGDEAVSPVIAVILMVAITVVLAATVYVWVSGFGSQSSSPAKSVALSSASALTTGTGANTDNKTYTIASATPGLKWSDVNLTLAGEYMAYNGTTDQNAAASSPQHANTWCVVTSGTSCASAAPTSVMAGQQIKIAGSSLAGKEFRVLDSQANSVILTLTIG